MSDIFHINISSNATSKMELYKIWDNDLKNIIKKRGRWEWAIGISILFVVSIKFDFIKLFPSLKFKK